MTCVATGVLPFLMTILMLLEATGISRERAGHFMVKTALPVRVVEG